MACGTSKNRNQTIEPNEALKFLHGQSELSREDVNDLLSFLEHDDVKPFLIGSLLQRRQLDNEVVKKLVERIKESKGSEGEQLALMGQSAAIEPLIKIMEDPKTSESVANRAGYALESMRTLDDSAVDRLRRLLYPECPSTLAAAKVLCRQSELCPDIMLALHKFIFTKQGQDKYTRVNFETLWQSRSMEQFCTHLESFDHSATEKILCQVLLKREMDEITRAYINGDEVFFYTSEGDLRSFQSKNEKATPESFQEAQEKVGIPEWA